MKKIFKYPLGIRGRFTILTCEGAEAIHAAGQGDHPTVWMEVDTDRPIQSRDFQVLFTGDPVDNNNLQYLGTAFVRELVCHVYEVLT